MNVPRDRNVLRAVWLFKQAGKSFRRLEESASTLNLATHISEEPETKQVKNPFMLNSVLRIRILIFLSLDPYPDCDFSNIQMDCFLWNIRIQIVIFLILGIHSDYVLNNHNTEHRNTAEKFFFQGYFYRWFSWIV